MELTRDLLYWVLLSQKLSEPLQVCVYLFPPASDRPLPLRLLNWRWTNRLADDPKIADRKTVGSLHFLQNDFQKIQGQNCTACRNFRIFLLNFFIQYKKEPRCSGFCLKEIAEHRGWLPEVLHTVHKHGLPKFTLEAQSVFMFWTADVQFMNVQVHVLDCRHSIYEGQGSRFRSSFDISICFY